MILKFKHHPQGKPNARTERTSGGPEPHKTGSARDSRGCPSEASHVPTPPDGFPGLGPPAPPGGPNPGWDRSGLNSGWERKPGLPTVFVGARASPEWPAPRPQASDSTRRRPRPGEALLSPSPGVLPCVGLGTGRREGLGANEPRGGSGNSSRKYLRGDNKAIPSVKEELGRR